MSGSCTLPPRWPPQCSCVVIESSFDPGERLQSPGSLWFSYIMARTSTFFQLYHGENKLQFVSYIMVRTSYNLSAISWREQVTFFQLYYGENKYIFSAISWWERATMRWCLLCTRQTRSVVFVLAYWTISLRVDMSLYSDTLSLFQAYQSLLLLLNVACLAEKQQ